MLPEEHDSFCQLANWAFEKWAPGAEVVYKNMPSGFSGSVVRKVDVRGGHDGKLDPGQYILKLSHHSEWSNQEHEITAHERALDWNRPFSEEHVPKLVESEDSDELKAYAMLYEIAGSSIDAYIATDKPESNFHDTCFDIIKDTLSNWTMPDPSGDKRPHELLEAWLGYRLDPAEASDFHARVAKLMGDSILQMEAGEVILNPLGFYELAKAEQWDAHACLTSLLHGDLHGGNILLHRRYPKEKPYWIIDFGLSSEGPAGYDQAYLEVAQVISSLGANEPAYLIDVLTHIDEPESNRSLPREAFWVKECLLKMRAAVEEWRDDAQPRRIDDVDRQILLARVAAGLNWANKPIGERQQYLALCYAGWAAREYMKRFEIGAWNRLWNNRATTPRNVVPSDNDHMGNEVVVPSPNADAGDEALWEVLWQTVGGFSSNVAKFILVTEPQGNQLDDKRLSAVGQLPWSVVVDLDPRSDSEGLSRYAAPILKSHRGLHTFSKEIPVVDYSRGTAWMMAGGWSSNSEAPTDYNSWIYEKLHLIRAFIGDFEQDVHPDPIYVIILPGGDLDPGMPMARLSKVVGAIDEVTRGQANFILLGNKSLVEPVKHTPVQLDSGTFLSYLEKTFGFRPRSDAAQVPGPDNTMRTIPLDALRTMQENMDVLHSNILEEKSALDPTGTRDEFWRGHPPSWADFDAGLDIERAFYGDLRRNLDKQLSEGRNYTVVMHHHPGAGGTTVAYRAAWDLRLEYPTAILTSWSSALPTRLQNLYNIAQKPILLVADSAELTETAREELHRVLSQSNTRVVLLYVRRTLLPRESSQQLVLYDPMELEEARAFCEAYSALTDDERRRQELRRITEDETLERYRTPFFYGLITFEHDFVKVDQYVASHLKGVRGKVRDIIEYLCLISIYSNSGLHETVVQKILGLTGDQDFPLTDLLGEGPARLVSSQRGHIRMLHQVIAEETLSYLHGGRGDVRLELSHISQDLIRDVATSANPDSKMVKELFRQIFLERYGVGINDPEERRQRFSPLIEEIDQIDGGLGNKVLVTLTESCPNEAHFWTHLGRHQSFRMRRDREMAVEYLERAINISPDDYIHYHTLGVVLKDRITRKMFELREESGAEILDAISKDFEYAVWAFGKARTKNPESRYGYISHVLLILSVANRLRISSNVTSIGDIKAEDPRINDWMQQNISMAEELLNSARQLYSTLDQQDSYLTSCLANLERLYGNVDEVIRLWELSHARGQSSAAGRRALANAYLARSGGRQRRWRNMQRAELQRIADLMEQNLRSSGRRGEDYRLWFEAYKLLPEFDIDEALTHLKIWGSHDPTSWRANYFMYVLHFYLWFSGRTDSRLEFEECLDQCQRLARGHKTFSYQWLGYTPELCPLVSESDLGDWNKAKGFWKETHPLRRINGFIDDPIPGPQAGNIKIGGQIKAFFVPARGDFYAHKDENEPVNFFLGFSPTGLRAWSVERGHVPDGDRISFSKPAKEVSPVYESAQIVSERAKLERVQSLKKEHVEQFIKDFVAAQSALGVDLTLEELEGRLEATFGVDGIVEEVLRAHSLHALLKETDKYQLTREGSTVVITADVAAEQENEPSRQRAPLATCYGQIVQYDWRRDLGYIKTEDGQYSFRRSHILPEYRSQFLRRGMLVEFKSDSNEQGPVAIEIRILEDSATLSGQRILGQDELRKSAKYAVLRILDDAVMRGESTSLKEMSHQLSAMFLGRKSLPERLGVEKISHFLNTIEEIYIEGEWPDLKVRLKVESAFGRLPKGNKSLTVPEDGSRDVKSEGAESEPLHEAVRTRAIELVHQRAQARQQDLTVMSMGALLGPQFPGLGRLAERLGYKSIAQFLETVPELELYGENPKHQSVRLRGQDVEIHKVGHSK